jgi:hypothetical protein
MTLAQQDRRITQFQNIWQFTFCKWSMLIMEMMVMMIIAQ